VTGDVAVDGLQVIDAGVVSSAEDLEGPPQPIIRVGDDELASLSF
jgi:hypothetical protein